MATDDDRPGLPPPHPGEYLKEDILPALGMTITGFARHLGVTRATMSDLLNGKRAVSTDMAIRLGQALKNGARFWLALQMQHDLWMAERESTLKVRPLTWKEDDRAA